MRLTSLAFGDSQKIPTKYTCQGEDVNPPLDFHDVSEDAKSLVLIVYDPDAPGEGWVHWTVWNISPNTKKIDEDSVPEEAMQGMTDFGKPGYGGPCPPFGKKHRYQFRLYALDDTLDLAEVAGKGDVEKAMERHIIDETMLIGLYEKIN